MYFCLSFCKKNALQYNGVFNLLFRLLVLAGTLSPLSSFGQVSSNEGTEFWVAFPTHEHDYSTDGTIALPNLSIFITSSQASSGKVSAGTFSQSFTVGANDVTEIRVPREQAYIDISESGKVLTNRAVHITVDAGQPKIVVYAHIYAAQRSAASLILPADALGKAYNSVNFKSTGEAKNFIALVATQPNTKIHLLRGNSELVAGGITLPKVNDVFEYTSDEDLTGTRIVSDGSACNSFAVFSGTSGSVISDGNCISKTIDPLYQQLYPIKSWGYTYGLVPFSTHSIHFDHPVRTTGYHFRVVAGENGTRLSINGIFTSILNTGEFYSSEQTGAVGGDTFISADKPVSVAQYALSESCSNQNAGTAKDNYSDPDMVIINPIEYNIKNITIFSSSRENISEQYVNILIKSTGAASFRINGQKPATSFQPMKNLPGYSYLQLDLTTYPKHTFNLMADEGFNAIAYGFGNVESYAYSAGTNLAANYSLTAIKTPDNIVIDSACVNDDYFFRLTLPYASPKITWQMDGTELPYTALNPDFIKITYNGKAAYEYTLPKTAAYDIAGIHHIHIIAYYPADECSSTATQDILQEFKVNPLPNVKITANQSDCVNVFTFEDKTSPIGTTLSRIWDFGDPADNEHNHATSQMVKHTYIRNGTYTITLTVMGVSGCDAIKSSKIVVTGNVPVNFEVAPVNCINKAVAFNYIESPSTEFKPVTWKWYYGDGDSTISHNNQLANHYYKLPGTYQARLILVSQTGCLNYSNFKAITILAPPAGDFDFQDICAGDIAKFTIKNTLVNNLQFSWDFGDAYATSENANLATSAQANHIYTHDGEYPVTLKISSNEGCEMVIIKTMHVYSNAIAADFTAENTCAGQAVSFKNISKITGYGTISKIEWYFEPESAPDKMESYIYPYTEGPYLHTFVLPGGALTGTVKVKLKVFTAANCFREVTKNITLLAVPGVIFNPVDDLCEDAGPVQIIQGKETTGIAGTGYYSGDGITPAGLFDPQQAGTGSHLINYTFVAQGGCTSFASQQIRVLPKPGATFPANTVTITQGRSALLNPAISGSGLTFKWSPSAGLNRDDIAAPIASPIINTTYTLMVTNGACTNGASVTVNVLRPIMTVNTFTPNADGINDIWLIGHIEDYPHAVVQIFNRYGIELYHATGYSKPWNGKYRGQEVPSGVYYYVITPGEKQDKIKGYITLLR